MSAFAQRAGAVAMDAMDRVARDYADREVASVAFVVQFADGPAAVGPRRSRWRRASRPVPSLSATLVVVDGAATPVLVSRGAGFQLVGVDRASGAHRYQADMPDLELAWVAAETTEEDSSWTTR
jgi:hypothetical protein